MQTSTATPGIGIGNRRSEPIYGGEGGSASACTADAVAQLAAVLQRHECGTERAMRSMGEMGADGRWDAANRLAGATSQAFHAGGTKAYRHALLLLLELFPHALPVARAALDDDFDGHLRADYRQALAALPGDIAHQNAFTDCGLPTTAQLRQCVAAVFAPQPDHAAAAVPSDHQCRAHARPLAATAHGATAAARQPRLQADLLTELKYAHKLLAGALYLMAPAEKAEFAQWSERSGIGVDGASRHHERAAAIATAELWLYVNRQPVPEVPVSMAPPAPTFATEATLAEMRAQQQAYRARASLLEAARSAREPLRSELLAAVSSLPSLG